MAVPEARAGCLKSSHSGDGQETKRPDCALNKPGLGNAPLLPSESEPPISAGLLPVLSPPRSPPDVLGSWTIGASILDFI